MSFTNPTPEHHPVNPIDVALIELGHDLCVSGLTTDATAQVVPLIRVSPLGLDLLKVEGFQGDHEEVPVLRALTLGGEVLTLDARRQAGLIVLPIAD